MKMFLDESVFPGWMRVYLTDGDELRMECGWKMLMLLQEMLLARRRGGRISQRKLQTRINMFTTGQWHLLMEVSNECARAGVEGKVRASRRSGRDDIKSRVCKTKTLAHVGELSATRQALDGAEVALGNLATAQLTSPERRPPTPRDLLSGSATAVPERPFELDPELFCKNVLQHVVGAHRARLACQSNISLDGSSLTTMWKFSTVLPQSSAKGTGRSGRVPIGTGDYHSRHRGRRYQSKIDRTHHRPTDLETSRGSYRTTPVRIADEVKM